MIELFKRTRVDDETPDNDDAEIEKILESMVRNPYEESPAKRDRDESGDEANKSRRICSVEFLESEDDVVDINLVECWVDDGDVFFGMVEDDAVVMSPMVDVGL